MTTPKKKPPVPQLISLHELINTLMPPASAATAAEEAIAQMGGAEHAVFAALYAGYINKVADSQDPTKTTGAQYADIMASARERGLEFAMYEAHMLGHVVRGTTCDGADFGKDIFSRVKRATK